MSEIYIVIPAKDEEMRIEKVIQSIVDYGYENIIVVNDASHDNTAEVVKKYSEVTLINHIINLGSGGATRTGLDYCVRKGAKYIATIDGDGQHKVEDLDTIVREIVKDEYDLILGSRFKKENDIPNSRIFFNKVGNIISLLLTGKYISDSQSGLKAMTAILANKLSLEYNGYEFCMEIIKNARFHKARITEIPISVMYDKDTTQKGQNLSSGFGMIRRILSPF